ncbi:hypothetical protein Emtol_0982 [Emticicia oligotrophica DSM 17448]|uniref:Uncharacterized protein n=1 Tax=Emticicia oligotrophica (strain DSM 17448 / CIP 109782 / MTCC 6937 / GPTSA100-15) TaxID=929562 RepID=A0ABN4AJC5_EMTOG|nr:hypothetical protein [Emticicia oligotrophica]AFK02133.1 hypothetical protein Emtol_0982 [Emticicia oligotrophica DSM 17448]
MHEIEPTYNWRKYYISENDRKSPFYGRSYGQAYEDTIYGYYIDPNWDSIGSETLYCKILMVDYSAKYAVIELFGEWNDTLHNDSMYFKRTVVDHLLKYGIKYYILIGENILQFHGGETDYYEEWFEDIEDGWIAAVSIRDFIMVEFRRYHLDSYINFGGTLQISNWRTLKPNPFFELISNLIMRRLG